MSLVSPLFARSELHALKRAALAILFGVQLSLWIFLVPLAWRGHADFRQLYTAGFMLRSGQRHVLYDYESQGTAQSALVNPEATALPFNHLAYEALFFAPFSFLPYRAAYVTFLIVNMGLLGLAARLARSAASAPLWIAFLPVPAALVEGQDSILQLALFAAGWLGLHRRKDLLAGVVVGLAMFKFQVILPLAFLFLLWRRWRFCFGLAASAIATVSISALLVGWKQSLVYVHSLGAMSTGLNSDGARLYGISPEAMPNLRGLIFSLSAGHLTVIGEHLLLALASLTVLIFVALKYKSRGRPEELLLAITTGDVVSYHLFIYDWSNLLLPITAVANRTLRGRTTAVTAVLLFLTPLGLILGRQYFFLGSLPLLGFLGALLYDNSSGSI